MVTWNDIQHYTWNQLRGITWDMLLSDNVTPRDIMILDDGIVLPFYLQSSQDTKFTIIAETRDALDENEYADGDIDFGTVLGMNEFTLHGVVEFDSIAERNTICNTLRKQFNDCRQPQTIGYEYSPNRYTIVRLAQNPDIIRFPYHVEVRATFKADPFWYGVEVKTLTGNGVIVNEGTHETGFAIEITEVDNSNNGIPGFVLQDVRGGNYVQYDGVTYLKLTGNTTRVMDLELSGTSKWTENPNWPTKDELLGDDWSLMLRKANAAYWTATTWTQYYAHAVNMVDGDIETIQISATLNTRLCHTLPENLYVTGGSGTANDSYTVSSPHVTEITVGDDILRFYGLLTPLDKLVIDTEHKTVKLNGLNALKDYNNVFPKLPPGKDVVVTAPDGNITVKWRDKWV